MPKIIRRALVEKFAGSPEWGVFREDFLVATGFRLEVVDEFGRHAPDPGQCGARICCDLQSKSREAASCAQFRQDLLAKASKTVARGRCPARLCEVAIPLRVGAVTAGYLVFGGFRTVPSGKTEWDRAKRFFEQHGFHGNTREWRADWESTPELTEQKCAAYIHFVELAVRLFSERMTLHLAPAELHLPDPVKKACRFLRRECLLRNVTLGDAAQHVGMSEGHFSRTFHHSTGLTFGEYVGRHRVDRARELMKDPRVRITDAAFASGFQSLSQFHRIFRKIVGASPREFRKSLRAP
ncbi:MAG: helix-turn-helix domain-containing protein [Verrucomicrobia bacterium]|nr:helix-turn-helix domain-containing protein [Verrucomicrobiota bacterium]